MPTSQHLFNIAICLHGVTTNPANRSTYVAYIEDVKAQILHLKSQGYEFVNGAQYRSWLKGEWVPSNPICCIMWDDARGNANDEAESDMSHQEGIQLIMPWLIRNKISCCIPIITRRQRKYQPEEGYCSWKMIKKWMTESEGRIDVMTHTHDIHHLAVLSEDGSAYSAEANPIFEGPCWIDNGDTLFIRGANKPWYWDQTWTETAFAIPIWGVDQFDGKSLCKTNFHITPKVSMDVKILRFWVSLTFPSGSGYDVPVRIKANGVTVFDGIIYQKNYETRDQWAEREYASITLDTPFRTTAGQMVDLEFETLEGEEGGPLMSVYCLPVYNGQPDPAWPGLNDDNFYAITNVQGWRPAGTEGGPERSWQYIDWPAGDSWPVVPMMILCDGTGRHATDAEYRAYIKADMDGTQFALKNYLHATWRELDVWEGTWDSNPDYELPFDPVNNKHVYMPNTGLQLLGWFQTQNVTAEFPCTSPETVVADGMKIWLGDVIPVNTEPDDWDAEWEEHQQRNYNIIFDVQISTDGVNWTTIGRSATWIAFRGHVFDITPTAFTAGVPKWIRLAPVNRGVTIDLPERECVYSIMKVILMVKDQVVGQPTNSLCFPFGAFQPNWVDADPLKAEWHDVSRNIQTVFTGAGIDTAYTIQVVRNYLHNGSDMGWSNRLSDNVRGRLMLIGTQPLKETLNLLDAYSGALFKDTKHNGTKWQVSLEGDLLGHGTVKRRINTVDYYAFDAWAFSGTDPIRIVKTSAPVNDGSYFPGFEDGWAAGTYADEKSWIQARGGKALIIINNNLGTGSPDSDAGKHIFDNADAYIEVMVRDSKAAGWDGITCNIEGVAVSGNDGADIKYRTLAVEFYKKLHKACHAAGLILHCTAPAATGNPNYDWIDWAGWCDHAEIIKYVDGMKLMSYTESFEWTMPRPAAWDVTPLMFYEDPSKPKDTRSFWQAVVEYARNTIPKAYKKRILMGARAFGHVWWPNWKGDTPPADIQAVIDAANADGEYHPMSFWKYTNDERVSMYKEGENGYLSYADFINFCGTYALKVQQDLSQDTTEMYFYSPRTEAKAWCGTPLTGARSAQIALDEGFGGVGIWKIDDGDIEEYYPEFKQFCLVDHLVHDARVPYDKDAQRFNRVGLTKLKRATF